MGNDKEQSNNSLDIRALHKIESIIQDKINTGYTAPRGWLFRGFTFFFFPQDRKTDGAEEKVKDSQEIMSGNIRWHLARNTARFAGASIATSLEEPGVTHVIVDLEVVSTDEVTSLRKSLAARALQKIPHLASLNWVEESWKHGTLLDEERKFLFLPTLP